MFICIDILSLQEEQDYANLKSLYSNTKILSKYIPSLQKRL
jgi:hypothetical protein